MKQLSLFDFFPKPEPKPFREPEVGEYTKVCGQVLCHIQRKNHIGKKVLIDVSTQSMRGLYKCGILEDYIEYEGHMRSIVFTGEKQRSLVTHYPGVEIRECMPWDWYEDRRKSIGGKNHERI